MGYLHLWTVDEYMTAFDEAVDLYIEGYRQTSGKYCVVAKADVNDESYIEWCHSHHYSPHSWHTQDQYRRCVSKDRKTVDRLVLLHLRHLVRSHGA